MTWVILAVLLSPVIAAAALLYFIFFRGFVWPFVSEAFFGGRKW